MRKFKISAMIAYNLWQTGRYSWESIAVRSEHPTPAAAMMAARRYAKAKDLPLRKANPPPLGEEKLRAAYQMRMSNSGRTWASIADEFGWASGASCQSSVTRWARRNNLSFDSPTQSNGQESLQAS